MADRGGILVAVGYYERQMARIAKWPAKHRHWSLRTDVTFDASNDHNPVVLDECPDCHGSRVTTECEDGALSRGGCSACGGTGSTGHRVPYFDNDRPIVDVPIRAGWITCPCCGWSFMLKDRTVWTGLRHVRCGQRVRPVDSGPP